MFRAFFILMSDWVFITTSFSLQSYFLSSLRFLSLSLSLSLCFILNIFICITNTQSFIHIFII